MRRMWRGKTMERKAGRYGEKGEDRGEEGYEENEGWEDYGEIGVDREENYGENGDEETRGDDVEPTGEGKKNLDKNMHKLGGEWQCKLCHKKN